MTNGHQRGGLSLWWLFVMVITQLVFVVVGRLSGDERGHIGRAGDC